jgi:hypothetical protein
MSTGILYGFISENPYYSLLNYKVILIDTQIAPKYYSTRHNRMKVREIYSFKSQSSMRREIITSLFKLHTFFIGSKFPSCINGNWDRPYGSNCFLQFIFKLFNFNSFSNFYNSDTGCSKIDRGISAVTFLKWQYQPFVINIHTYRPCLLVKTQVQYQLFNCNMLISKPKQH